MLKLLSALLPKEPKASTYIKFAKSLFTYLDTRLDTADQGSGKMTATERTVRGNGRSGKKKAAPRRR